MDQDVMKVNMSQLRRFPDSSSRTKEKQHPSQIKRVETMVSVIELLLETLAGLSDRELMKFKKVLQSQVNRERPLISSCLLKLRDVEDIVFLMALNDGHQSVERTKNVLKKMERTDHLVQRLSDSSTLTKKKHSVDKYMSALIHKVATMSADKELLLGTLSDLSSEELNMFKWLLQFTLFERNLPNISWRRLEWTDRADNLVDVMMEMYGQRSVEVTKEVFMNMNKTDLVQRLSETSSSGYTAAGASAEAFGVDTTEKEKHCVDENWPALIQKVETMASVIELLLETLKDLSDGELEKFKEILLSQTDFRRRFSDSSWMLLETIDRQVTVFLMVLTDGQQSVETTKEVLKKIKRTDLVQRLSDSSSGPKKNSEDHRPALIQNVASMAAVKQLVLETLNDLSYEELENFKWFLHQIVSQENLPNISSGMRLSEYRADIADVMVQTYGQQSVELTMKAVKEMNRTDQMQSLPETSSGLKDKHSVDQHRLAHLEKAAAKAALKQVLLEILEFLRDNDLEKFKWLLQFTQFQKGLPQISWSQLEIKHSAEALVNLLVQTCDQQSVEVTKEVLMEMNRTYLVKMLSETSSRLEGKQKEVSTTTLMEKLLETLEELSDMELEQFKHVLRHTLMEKGLQRHRMADRDEIVELMVETYGRQSVEVTRDVLTEMNRDDLEQKLSKIHSGSKGPSRSSELEGGGSIKQVSSDWIQLEPEVNSSDEDEAPTYSLQSEAGHFECSVSGLRWVCKERVNFKYQFGSWEEATERMKRIQYMLAGPLIDITVIAGKLDVVYMPHWICIDDNPTILDKFAVLHIDDCGDVVENVSEVTSSHVKLSEPVFSLRAALIKVGFPVKIACNVLIYYKSDTTFLKLHVYLIPHNPALQEKMNTRKKEYKTMEKPRPNKYLKMEDFNLTADIKKAKIQPEEITLEDSEYPNFFEVFIENPDSFKLILSHLYKKKGEPQREPVWTCEIHKVDYQTSGDSVAAQSSTGPGDRGTGRDKPSVDERLSALMKKAAAVTTDKERLLIMLEDLKMTEFDSFTWHLQNSDIGEDERIPNYKLENISMRDLVDEMCYIYIQKSVEVTKKVLENINRKDLVKILSETSSGSKAAGSSA